LAENFLETEEEEEERKKKELGCHREEISQVIQQK